MLVPLIPNTKADTSRQTGVGPVSISFDVDRRIVAARVHANHRAKNKGAKMAHQGDGVNDFQPDPWLKRVALRGGIGSAGAGRV